MTINAELRLADIPTGGWFRSSQRLEIMRLRKCLALAEQAASRYAVMLREGDHRIKNSLQLVSSLMNLQASGDIKLPPARDVLRTAAARIQSVARMHDALQLSGGENSVDLGSVLSQMCQSLQAMSGDRGAVAVRVNAEPINASVAFAQPVVLAVNELVINALRHAFPGGRTGAVEVGLSSIGGAVTIVVSDDGVGLPADHDQGHGYGMKLIHMMVSQIGGELRVESGAGVRCTLLAPLPA